MNLLQATGLCVSYGAIEAVRDIDIAVERGELVCLIGANGAGKTSTLKALAGMIKPSGGEIRHNSETVTGISSHELVKRGISLVPEGRGIFGRLTVEENLDMGAYLRNDRQAVAADLNRVFTLFPRLAERRGQTAGTLSGGEQQMLAIGRAMMSRPALLLLDEPSMGLAPMMVRKILETIQIISEEGVTILLVEQNARAALEISSRAYVMENGAISLSGPSRELADDPRVRHAYLGG
ncbi:MAG: ABC transporter ATP-binding protein [Nitrospirae bacterium]|nr:ABC transporter ATP-binding protein [Nitrospirota bacterium]